MKMLVVHQLQPLEMCSDIFKFQIRLHFTSYIYPWERCESNYSSPNNCDIVVLNL